MVTKRDSFNCFLHMQTKPAYYNKIDFWPLNSKKSFPGLNKYIYTRVSKSQYQLHCKLDFSLRGWRTSVQFAGSSSWLPYRSYSRFSSLAQLRLCNPVAPGFFPSRALFHCVCHCISSEKPFLYTPVSACLLCFDGPGIRVCSMNAFLAMWLATRSQSRIFISVKTVAHGHGKTMPSHCLGKDRNGVR